MCPRLEAAAVARCGRRLREEERHAAQRCAWHRVAAAQNAGLSDTASEAQKVELGSVASHCLEHEERTVGQ